MDEAKLNDFMGKLVGDLGAAASGALVVIGDKLGLYRALAKGGCTATELAKRTELTERYVREWLNAQAAAGYVSYQPATQQYALSEEQAFALADPTSPAYFAGAFQITQAMWNGIDKIAEGFKTGGGLAWGDQHQCLFEGTEKFFRTSYIGHLVKDWIPALDGVAVKLYRGARVADVGCGHGASTILMAQAFPHSTFYGFDSHAESVATANQRAKQAGVGDRVTFAVAKASDFPGSDYDLVAHFDCFHDLEDPAAAATRAKRALKSDGTWLIVEPFAADKPEDNHNPVGRVFYSASAMLCVPHSLSQHGPALGAQAGEAQLREFIVGKGGFSSLRRATQTPFNIVLEARP